MKIENVFGLHIGCPCYLEDEMSGDRGVIVQVKKGSVRAKYTPENSGRWYKISEGHSFIFLKPLSSVNKKDKKAFSAKFFIPGWAIDNLRLQFKDVVVASLNKEERRADERTARTNEIFWLAARGYDVGVVPDGYKLEEK